METEQITKNPAYEIRFVWDRCGSSLTNYTCEAGLDSFPRLVELAPACPRVVLEMPAAGKSPGESSVKSPALGGDVLYVAQTASTAK